MLTPWIYLLFEYSQQKHVNYFAHLKREEIHQEVNDHFYVSNLKTASRRTVLYGVGLGCQQQVVPQLLKLEARSCYTPVLYTQAAPVVFITKFTLWER